MIFLNVVKDIGVKKITVNGHSFAFGRAFGKRPARTAAD
jgi:hypothetical protein